MLSIRYIIAAALSLVSVLLVNAQTSADAKDHGLGQPTYNIFAEDAGKDAVEVDSIFFVRSLPTNNIQSQHRRELLAVKTNLLEWGAYVPQYGWCPMPNVELEYYPKRGHWTFGANFDFPWWKGNIDNHKYFELNNLQLYARYYIRNSNKSYRSGTAEPDGTSAFRGFYLSAYAHAFLYQIGFSENKGWVGEGIGGGIGIGYALPLCRSGRWKIDFSAQFGVFMTKYDPYVYGCPVENIKDGYYYYDYKGEASQFKKREYALTWLGPTRVGVSISYSLFYRRGNGKKGISLRQLEKGGAL